MKQGEPITLLSDHLVKGHGGTNAFPDPVIRAGTTGVVIDSKKSKKPQSWFLNNRGRRRGQTVVVKYLVKFPDGRKRWLRRKLFQPLEVTVQQVLSS